MLYSGGSPPSGNLFGSIPSLTFAANVRDANLFVDGKFIGPVGVLKGGIAIEPGKHRLELRHEDYFSSYLELQLARAERRTIALDMAVILP